MGGNTTPLTGRFFLREPRHLLPRQLVLLVVSAFALATVGCSSADPQFMQLDYRIIASVEPGSVTVRERLMVFADVHDPDGVDDVAWMVVEFPDHGVGWELEGDQLAYMDREGRHWFGSAELTVPGVSRLPRGQLRVIVGDLSGRTDEREVVIPRSPGSPMSATDGRVFIVRTIDSGETVIEAVDPDANPDEFRLFVHTRDDVFQLRRGRLVTEELRGRLGSAPFWLITELSPHYWIESGPWSLSGS